MAESTDSDSGAGKGVVFVFETSHHAFQAEDVARGSAVPAEVVPAPSGAAAKCGLALQVPDERAAELEEALRGEGIQFERFEKA